MQRSTAWETISIAPVTIKVSRAHTHTRTSWRIRSTEGNVARVSFRCCSNDEDFIYLNGSTNYRIYDTFGWRICCVLEGSMRQTRCQKQQMEMDRPYPGVTQWIYVLDFYVALWIGCNRNYAMPGGELLWQNGARAVTQRCIFRLFYCFDLQFQHSRWFSSIRCDTRITLRFALLLEARRQQLISSFRCSHVCELSTPTPTPKTEKHIEQLLQYESRRSKVIANNLCCVHSFQRAEHRIRSKFSRFRGKRWPNVIFGHFFLAVEFRLFSVMFFIYYNLSKHERARTRLTHTQTLEESRACRGRDVCVWCFYATLTHQTDTNISKWIPKLCLHPRHDLGGRTKITWTDSNSNHIRYTRIHKHTISNV